MMIELHDLWKKYGRTDALRGLDLAVPKGSAFALLGANGAGKTTLIRTIMNIIEPDRGRATVLGVDSRKLGPEQLARIGFVSENQKLPSRMTAGEFIAYVKRFYPAWDSDLEASILARMDLPLDRKIGNFSHGMKMKLRLATALPFRPELLVLDEPLSGLDPLIRDEFLEGMLEQADETTVLISSHELHEIEGIATHVAFIEEGRRLFQESIDSLRDRVREISVSLKDPSHAAEGLPAGWLNVKTVGSVISFVDTQFTEAGLAERIEGYFGPVQQLEILPLGLRPTFTAIARSLRRKGN